MRTWIMTAAAMIAHAIAPELELSNGVVNFYGAMFIAAMIFDINELTSRGR